MEDAGIYEELTIEPRGEGYVLIRDDGEGAVTELLLSENNVVFLGRLAPTVSRRIVASKALAGGDISASVAAPAKNIRLNSDLHNELVLLGIEDEFGGQFDFSFVPAGARHLGEKLIEWANKTEAATRPTKQ